MKYNAALVTGAGGRLGRAMAVSLGARGIAVAVHYAGSETGAKETVDMIRDAGGTAESLQADLLDHDATKALVGRAAEVLSQPLDILINNASIFEYDRLDTVTTESWERHLGSNLRAPLFLTKYFAKQAPVAQADTSGEQKARAAIINMTDQRVRKLTPEFMTYSLAKSALWTLTQTTAQALAPNIRVNAIGPGPTLQGARQSTKHFTNQRAATILERGANTPDITSAMNYLLDAPSVTGQLICVDGGQHLGWKTPDVQGVE